MEGLYSITGPHMKVFKIVEERGGERNFQAGETAQRNKAYAFFAFRSSALSLCIPILCYSSHLKECSSQREQISLVSLKCPCLNELFQMAF